MVTSTTTTTPTITAQNILQLFPEVDTTTVTSSTRLSSIEKADNDANASENDLSGHDAEQIRLMDEACIVLDADDQALGSASKKTCHLMTNINNGLLHRAFSVFLFHPQTHRLLLQQRASSKITFPDMWTNTCCSHPLACATESGQDGDLSSTAQGAKCAAQRKLDHELGIASAHVPVSDFEFLTRIHYLAPSDGRWGEHEIDYILFIQADPQLAVNSNEVRDTAWVSQAELKQRFRDAEADSTSPARFTPWFKLICESMLFEWWDAMIEGRLDTYIGDSQIKRM
jgi:isopentenyl-diphosphate Delta-isomerase